MSKKITLLIGCSLLVILSGCGTANNITNATTQSNTQPSENITEQIIEKEQSELLSNKDNISCIAEALNTDDNEKYACSVIDFLSLSGLPISTIVQAQMVGENEYSCRYLLEITDADNRCYVIGLEENYSGVGIKKDSKEGDWIFTVTK